MRQVDLETQLPPLILMPDIEILLPGTYQVLKSGTQIVAGTQHGVHLRVKSTLAMVTGSRRSLGPCK